MPKKTVEPEFVEGQPVAPEDTVKDLDVVPASLDDYPEDGALPHNSNDAPTLIELSNDQDNNPLVQGKGPKVDKTFYKRKKDETDEEYFGRTSPGTAPVQPGPTQSYLGKAL